MRKNKDIENDIYEYMKKVEETAKEVGITLEQATEFIVKLGSKMEKIYE